MFWCCGGGHRKDKTRNEFVSAVAGFNGGIVEGNSSGSDTSRRGRGQDDTTAAVEDRDADLGQQLTPRSESQAPPPYSELFGVEKNACGEADHCRSPPNAPGLTDKDEKLTVSSDQQTSIPTLVTRESLEHFESVRDDDAISQRPDWMCGSYSGHPPILLPAEKQETQDSAYSAYGSERRRWDDDGSVRPDWIIEMDSVDVDRQSIRPRWINETESVDSRSVRPDWMDSTASVGAPSTRPDWMDDTESMDPRLVRSWFNETASGIGEAESVGFGARQSSWLAKHDSVVDELESVRPGWMHDEARLQLSGLEDGVVAPPVGVPLSVSISPKNTQEKHSDSHQITMGGESSSEGASRPRSELAESPPAIPVPVTQGTPPGSRESHPDDGSNERVDEGGLLGLIMDTNEKEAIRRRNERLRSTERARRVFSSSPVQRNPRETDEQPPRQGTAEVPASKVRIIRSKTMPLSENTATTPPVAVRAKRTSTPTGSSRPGAAPPSPADEEHLSGLKDNNNISTTPPVGVRAKRTSTPTASSRSGAAPPSPSGKGHLSSLKDNDRPGGRGRKGRREESIKTPPAPRIPSAESRADAVGPAGAKEARRSFSGAQRVSFDGIPRNDSPRKKGKRASSPGGDRTSRSPVPATVAQRGDSLVVELPAAGGGARGEREKNGGTPGGKSCSTSKTFDSSSGSEKSAMTGKPVLNSEDLGINGSSPRLRPRTISESTSGTPPQQVVITASSPAPKPRDASKHKSSKSGKSKGSTGGSSRKTLTESSSADSTDGAKNNGSGSAQRRDRLPPGEAAPEEVEVVRVGPSRDHSSGQAVAGRKTASTSLPPSSRGEAMMWNSKDPAYATAATAPVPVTAAAAPAGSAPSTQHEATALAPQPTAQGHVQRGVRNGVAAPLCKPIVTGRRRGQQPFKLGTPRERKNNHRHSRLPPLEEEVGIATSPVVGMATSPVTIVRVRPNDVPGSSRDDKKYHPGWGSVKDLPQRLLEGELGGNDPNNGAPVASSPTVRPDPTKPPKPISKHQPAMAAASVTETRGDVGEGEPTADPSDQDEIVTSWLNRRAQPHFSTPVGPALSIGEDLFRRRGSQRFPRSSSWDDGSSSSFKVSQAMFSPGRFNPNSGALSGGGSVDDSCCDSSVISAMTAVTRNSSSTTLSAKGPSDRKLVAPRLSKGEKQAVERLKIERSDVHFGYRTVGGSERVYKIELSGEMRAAKVIDTLGISKEGMTEVLDIFDSELLALSRLTSPHIVQVYGASVSPAEIIVVSEFVEGGVLRRLLHNPRKLKDLTQRIRLGIAKDTASGMKTLYAHGMQHRHLSSNSILLTSDYRAKILGVGLTMTTELIDFFTGEERAAERAEKELPWTSREVVVGGGFSEKSDVYSFGIVLWEIMQKTPSLPYADLLPSEVLGAKYNGVGPSIPKDCPLAISALMKSCWSNLPADRPSFDKIVDTLEAICL